MQIAKLLVAKGPSVATISPDASILQAAQAMTARSIGALVVSIDDTTILGIISERDVVRAVSDSGASVLDAPVRSVMSNQVRTCGPDDLVDSLMATMTDHRIRHLPVLSDGKLSGIVSIGDLVKARMDELEYDRKVLEHYITAR